jgi:hypothetical protein
MRDALPRRSGQQPGGVEAADQRVGTEEVGGIALAFLFGEADHFQAERQALALAVQLAHGQHRHEDAQPPVEAPGAAHGVVVRCRSAGPRAWRAVVIAADDVAHRVAARHVSKPQSRIHVINCSATAVCVGVA